jgi:hypothetical protein
VRQRAPEEFAIPDSPIRALREVEAVTAKVVYHAIGGPGIVKRLKERRDGAAHFCVGIDHGPSEFILDIADR